VPFTVTLSVANGQLHFGSAIGSTVSFTGALADVNRALAALVYAPAKGFAGPDILHILVADTGNAGTADGGIDTWMTSADLVMHVGGFKAAPVITLPRAARTPVDKPLVFGGLPGKGQEYTPPVTIAGSASVATKGAKLVRLFSVMLAVQDGTLRVRGATGATVTFTGTLAEVNRTLTTLAYVPAVGFAGRDTLHIQVTDLGDRNDPFDADKTSAADLCIQVG